MVEKKLRKLEKEQLKQKLIAGYQERTKNKKLQKMLQTYGEMSREDISTELVISSDWIINFSEDSKEKLINILLERSFINTFLSVYSHINI